MAHRPIAIDGAGADGSAEGAGGVKPGPSNDHGGDGAVPTAPPGPSTRDKDAVCHRIMNERRLPKPPKSQHWVWKRFMVDVKEAVRRVLVFHGHMTECYCICTYKTITQLATMSINPKFVELTADVLRIILQNSAQLA